MYHVVHNQVNDYKKTSIELDDFIISILSYFLKQKKWNRLIFLWMQGKHWINLISSNDLYKASPKHTEVIAKKDKNTQNKKSL